MHMGNPFDASLTNVYILFFTGILARAPLLDGVSTQPPGKIA